MTATNGLTIPKSTNMYTSDDLKLCFNKAHFNRSDFNVERFMNLARQKSDLKTIQQDLRIYMKSLQNSMVELINDDYADFVHLSSKLVSLEESLNKINEDIDVTWDEFLQSIKDTVGTSEKIEQKCEELNSNREKQADLRNRILFLSSIDKLSAMLNSFNGKCTVLFLENVASFVIELKSQKYIRSDEEESAYVDVIDKLKNILSNEIVNSISNQCKTLPLMLSIASLIDCTHLMISRLISDYLFPNLVESTSNPDEKLKLLYKNVMKERENWVKLLGAKYCGRVRTFLDEALLTFVLTFIEKYMGTVAVPSDTRLFHRCYMTTQNFIENFPNSHYYRQELKSIRDKFNLVVYFKLEVHKFTKDIDIFTEPEKFCLNDDMSCEEFYCKASRRIFESICHIWDDDVYIPTIVDKLWDFTLRNTLKHFSWSKEMKSYIKENGSEDLDIPKWKCLLFIRSDASELQSQVFDFALENIWTKLKDIEVDTSVFGQCLTKHGVQVDSLCNDLDEDVVEEFAKVMNAELSQVSDVPKHYRWTKKPAPLKHSAYVENSISMINELRNNLENINHTNADDLIQKLVKISFSHFAVKAKEVQDSVEATGSSLSRFKRKTTPDGAVSDDQKIKIQIFHDAKYLLEKSREIDVDVEGLELVSTRFEEEINRLTEQKENETVE